MKKFNEQGLKEVFYPFVLKLFKHLESDHFQSAVKATIITYIDSSSSFDVI